MQFLWAPHSFAKQGRTVLGQCEEVTFCRGPWQKGRQQQQMADWFGAVPDCLITLGALLRESNAVISSHYTGMQAEIPRNLTGMVRINADYMTKVLAQALKIELGAKLPPATYLEKSWSVTP